MAIKPSSSAFLPWNFWVMYSNFSGAPLIHHWTMAHILKIGEPLPYHFLYYVRQKLHMQEVTHYAVCSLYASVPAHVSTSEDPFRHDYLFYVPLP